MEGFEELALSLPKLSIGEHLIFTEVNADFFHQFADAPIHDGIYGIKVVLDKKPGLYLLNIDAEGWFLTNCDRCLTSIQLPHSAKSEYYIEIGEIGEGDEDEFMIRIDEKETVLDIRPLVYETIVLSMPIVNVYECREKPPFPCDEEVLSLLDQGRNDNIENSENDNPVWDVLKDINFKD